MSTDERFELYCRFLDRYGPNDPMTLSAWYFYRVTVGRA